MSLETTDQTNNGLGPRVRRVLPVHKGIRAISIFGSTEAESRANQADSGLTPAALVGAPTIAEKFATFSVTNHLTLPVAEPNEVTFYLAFRFPDAADLGGAGRGVLGGWFDNSLTPKSFTLYPSSDTNMRLVADFLDGSGVAQTPLVNLGFAAGTMKSQWNILSAGIRMSTAQPRMDVKNHTSGLSNGADLTAGWTRSRAPAGRVFRWGAGLNGYTGPLMGAYGIVADTYHTVAERDTNAAAMRAYLNEVRSLGVPG